MKLKSTKRSSTRPRFRIRSKAVAGLVLMYTEKLEEKTGKMINKLLQRIEKPFPYQSNQLLVVLF